MSDSIALLIGAVLLGLNAFFVGAEFALIAARRSEIELRAEAGSRAAKITLGAMENVSLMMAGAQLGITICSIGLGYIAEPALAHLIEPLFDAIGIPASLLHPVAFAIALSIVVYLHVVLGEMVPKNIALAGAERTALVLGPPLLLIVRVLRPAIGVLNWIANVVLRCFGVEPKDEVTSAFTRDEVAGFVAQSQDEGLLDSGEGQLLLDALQFEDRTARAVLLPLDQLVTVAPDVSPADVEELAGKTGFSRFPVRGADGTLTGYVHLKDLLAHDEDRDQPIGPEQHRKLPNVAVTDRLRLVLQTMQRSQVHLARVRDEMGTVIGVVALEDVLEELVGEIRDETQRATG